MHELGGIKRHPGRKELKKPSRDCAGAFCFSKTTIFVKKKTLYKIFVK
jgi:hypothetical protein